MPGLPSKQYWAGTELEVWRPEKPDSARSWLEEKVRVNQQSVAEVIRRYQDVPRRLLLITGYGAYVWSVTTPPLAVIESARLLREREALSVPAAPSVGTSGDKPIIGFRTHALHAPCQIAEDIVFEDTGFPSSDGLSFHDLQLLSPMEKALWPGPVVEAGCSQGEHKAPGDDCSCGLYALHHLPDNWSRPWSDLYAASLNGQLLMSVVAGYGKVMVHDKRWRAEEVHVLAIIDLGPDFLLSARAAIANRFDIPLIASKDAPKFASDHGQTIEKEDAPKTKYYIGGID